ncbi:MAG: hypothetical protein ACYTFT_03725 [Planctomycetota bacterium]
MDEKEPVVRLRYVGDDIVAIPGVGTFQGGTEAEVPRRLAFDLLESDDWAIPPQTRPAVQLVLRVGDWDGPPRDESTECREESGPVSPEDFGDLPADGPEPAPGF